MTKYGHSDVVFLGDSITQGWEDTGEQIWDSEIAPYRASNFGFSGDRTDHVLWRLQNGEIFGMKPKVVVVMIGTNNLTFGENPEQTAAGVRTVVQRLQEGLPTSKILLLGIFPRGEKPDDAYRQRVAQTNELLKGSADGKVVVYSDISSAFISSDGTLATTLFPDGLHPSEDGYRIWAHTIEPELNALLKR